MRAVVQRVREARIRVGEDELARMGRGLLALVGVARGDDSEAARGLARRLVALRVFEDDSGRMSRSLLQVGGALGVVSNFTLLGDTRQGRRPSFTAAAPADQAAPLLDLLVEEAREQGVTVVTGRFRSTMEVELTNTGPVTLLIDSDRHF